MWAGFEPLAGVIRVFQEGKQYGDRYEWVASVRFLMKDAIEILGYTKPVTPSIWRALRKECQRLSIRRVLAVSYRNGQRREKWINIGTSAQEYYQHKGG